MRDYILKSQVFASGAAVLALEFLASRLIAPYFGSTIFVWGSLIGVVMISLALGYHYGGRLADRSPSFNTFSLIIFLAGAYMVFVAALAPSIFDFILRLKLGERYGPLAASIILIMVPSWLLGMVSPYAIRLKVSVLQAVGSVAGGIYSLSTVGSIAGTFVTVFILIPEFGVTQILLAFSFLLISMSLFSLQLRMKPLAILLLSLTLMFGTVSPPNPSGVVYASESLYHRILVVDNPVTDVRALILDNNYHSAMSLTDPEKTIFLYTDFFHLGFLFNPDIKKVLFVGGGGYTGPKKFLHDYPEIEVDVVEIDPEVVQVAKNFFNVPEDPRLTTYVMDGRVFLANSEEKYDLIVLDAYARTYIPFHMLTVEFFREVRGALTPQGVVVLNLIASLEGETSQILKAEYKTMSQVFPSVYLFPVSTKNPNIIQNIIVVATQSERKISREGLARMVEASPMSQDLALPPTEYIERLWERELKVENAPVLTDNFAPVESLLNPITGQPFVRAEVEGSVVLSGDEPPILQDSLALNDSPVLPIFVVLSLIFFVGIILTPREKKIRDGRNGGQAARPKWAG